MLEAKSRSGLLTGLLFGLLILGLSYLVVRTDADQMSSSKDCGYYSAYGTVFNQNQRYQPLNTESAMSVLQSVENCLRSLMSEQKQSALSQAIDNLKAANAAKIDLLQRKILRVELAYSFAGETDKSTAQVSINRAIIDHLKLPNLKAIIASGGDSASTTLRNNGWKKAANLGPGAMKDYLNTCQSIFGGNIPPIGKWDKFKSVPDADLHILAVEPLIGQQGSADASSSGTLEANFFYYKFKKDNSFCVALDRKFVSESLFGAICYNPIQKQACFFDNKKYRNDGELEAISKDDMLTTSFSELAHPADLKDRCSDCHMGQNPFVVNPRVEWGQAIRNLYLSPANENRSPFGLVDVNVLKDHHWRNVDSLTYTTSKLNTVGACMMCHDLPKTKDNSFSQYFSTVFTNVLLHSMPNNYIDDSDNLVTTTPMGTLNEDFCFDSNYSPEKEFRASVRALTNYFGTAGNDKLVDPTGKDCWYKPQ